MGAENKPTNQSRRDFFSVFSKSNKKEEMVNMLTPDGKLVSVPKSVVTKSTTRQQANNEDILNWMNNPSKEKK
jgi:hypothetical protein